MVYLQLNFGHLIWEHQGEHIQVCKIQQFITVVFLLHLCQSLTLIKSTMRIIYTLLLTGMLCGVSSSNFAQTNQYVSKEDSKIVLFTPAEKDRIQIWFLEQSEALKLSANQSEQYSNMMLANLSAIFRLTDPDKGYSFAELKDESNKVFIKVNEKAKPILNDEQYQAHLVTMARLQKILNDRLDNPSEETNSYDYLKEKQEED